MGTASDTAFLAQNLAAQGYAVLTPDLPFHGKSIQAKPDTMTEAADLIFQALGEVLPKSRRPFPIAVIGYSMGGRLAFEMTALAEHREQCNVQIKLLIMLSAAPSPRADFELERELCESVARRRSEQLRDLELGKQAYQTWLLRSWYAAPMWGGINQASGFQKMINSRVDAFDSSQRDAWCDAAVCMGRATMTEPPSKLNTPTLYICGVRDEKYLSWSAEIIGFLEDVLVVQIHEAGHNVILQRPDIVQSCLTDYLEQKYRKDPLNTPIRICAVKVLPYTIPLKQCIIINGREVSQREGVLVALLEVDGCAGIGDVCPLPGLHEETISTCVDELSNFTTAIEEIEPNLCLSDVAGSDSLLNSYSPATRSGLESAFLHLASSCTGMLITDCLFQMVSALEPRLTYPSREVFINGVLPRMKDSDHSVSTEAQNRYHDYVSGSHFDTLKLKVGASDNVESDADMVTEATRAATCHGRRVRLDANRAWTSDKFSRFLSRMKERVTDIEFIEEPLRSNDELETYLDSISNDTNKMFVALDESLASGVPSQIRRMASSKWCKALILKPCVLGSFRQMIELKSISIDYHCNFILSTCFESGVGTAWATILASVFGTNPSRHGLGTYSYICEDRSVPSVPSFASHCAQAKGLRVAVIKCEELLELAVEQVMNVGLSPTEAKEVPSCS